MKKILVLAILIFLTAGAEARYKWEKISYYHATGPVSPEYQYNYNILIDEEGNGKLEYTKSGKTNVYNFNVSKRNVNALNKAILSSKVLSVSSDELKSEKNLIGGPVNSCTITLPFPDEEEYDENEKEKPPVIIIPNFVTENYSAGVNNLYLLMETLVPDSIWEQAQGEW